MMRLGKVRVACVYGEESKIVIPETQAFMRHVLGEHIAIVGLPGAGLSASDNREGRCVL